MTLVFAVETLAATRAEAEPLLMRHWDEVALNKETVPLDPDWEMYSRLEAGGIVHVTTARRDGKLVGYAAFLLTNNLHYRTLRVAEGDIFWLAPECRRGRAGIDLMRAAEAQLRDRGVHRIVNKVKLHIDVGPVFEYLGYKPIERIYAKMVN